MEKEDTTHLIEFAKKHTTHRIELTIGFDPKKVRRSEVEKIILTYWGCCEIIEHKPEKDNSVRIFIYILFMEEWWNIELIKLHINGLLGDITFPDGIKRSDITVKVKKLI